MAATQLNAEDVTGESHPPRAQPPTGAWRYRLAVAALAIGVTWAAFFGLGRTPLCEPAEGLNADIARTMIESGDWVVPHHNGALYVDKPPLFYWVTTLGLRLLGDDELGARFGVALVGLVEVVLIYLLGNVLYGRPAGLFAAAVLATSVGHLVFTRLMMVDTLLSTCLTATFLCFALGYRSERHRLAWWTLAGAATGLAVLTKSLVGAVLPVATIALFVVATRQWRLLRQKAVAGAVLGFLVVALPWHVLMGERVPGFAHQYFFNEQVLRFFGKREPADYVSVPVLAYLTSSFVWATPWSFFLPQMIWRFRRRKRDGSPPGELAAHLPWLWLLVVVGFFALSRGRLFYYTLPGLGAFALLAGWFWSDTQRQSRGFHRTLALTMLGALLSAPLAIAAVQRFGAGAMPAPILHQLLPCTIAIGVCIAFGGLAGAGALLLRRPRLAFAALCCGVLATVVPITGLFGAFGRYTSIGGLVRSARLTVGPNDVVVHRFVRDDNSELPFYLHHRVRVLKQPGEPHQPIVGDRQGYYIEEDELARLWRSPQPVFLLVSQPAMPEQRPKPLPPGATILARDLDATIACNAAAATRFVRSPAPGADRTALRRPLPPPDAALLRADGRAGDGERR